MGTGVKYVINLACQYGSMAIVKSLFADARVDLLANDNIVTAAKSGQCGIVQLLIKNERVNRGQDISYQLLLSSTAGYIGGPPTPC